MRKMLAVFVLIAAFAGIPFAAAQNITGAITGVVRDPSGAVVPNAALTAVNTGTGAQFRATTDDTGVYTIQQVPVGLYDLRCELSGFKTYDGKGVRVQVNEVSRVDITLSVGTTTETIEVTSQVVSVDTTSATLKAVVDQRRIEELPLNGRNATQLMRLVSGVQVDARTSVTSGTTYPGVVPVSVNGQRANTTNYVLDGGQNNDHYSNAPNPMPNPDALQEFSVQTNNFSAEFGRQSGGVVNAVTKSGTNQLHGSAFEYVRNHALNAKNFFAPILPNGKKQDDGLKRNQFGATVGGPIWLPRIYNGHDKSFFFFSYQGTIEKQRPTSINRIVPTAAQRRGDFSALGRQLRDPFRGGFYPNNQIPSSDFNSVSQYVMQKVPVPAVGNTISMATPQNVSDDQVLVRGDHQLSQVNRLTGRLWISNAEIPAFLDPANYLSNVTARTWRNTSVVLTDTHTFGSSLVNTALFSFNRTNGGNIPIPPDKSLTDLGVKMWNDDPYKWQIDISGYFGVDTNDTNFFLRDEYQASDTLRWSRGRHQFTFGGEYGRGIGGIVNNYRSSGQFTFNGSAPFTGDALADFIVGKFQSMRQGRGEYKDTRFTILNFFAQDSIRLTPRFNLDIGVRWEPFFPYTDLNGKLSAWRPGERSTRYRNAPVGVLYPGDPGLPDGGYNTAWGNLGPRFGFAWDVFGNGKTSVRGGYGIFFDRSNTIGTNSQANQAPFGTVVDVLGNARNNFSDPWAGDTNPFPTDLNPGPDAPFAFPHTAFVYEEHMRNAYVQAWNLTIEREVALGFVGRIAYAGSKGTRLVNVTEGNPAIYAPGATTATTHQRRRLYSLGYGQVSLVEATGNSTYHSMQLVGERRFSKGLSILANYTWSKSLDDSSENKVTGQNVVNVFNRALDKGPSNFDHKHVVNISGLWEVPFKPANRAANFLCGGWSLNAIASMFSGAPIDITSGADNARSGTGGQRADLAGDPYFSDDRSRGEQVQEWLRKTAFRANALGTFGNVGRNAFRGPGYASVDLGLHKTFRVTENLKTQFRFETFNAFNRVNLGNPNTSFSSGNFMRISSNRDPRILQFALRLIW